MTFVSKSQAAQDRFVHALLPQNDGSFLDVGCGHPEIISNTFALEAIGWRGLLVDNSPEAVEACKLVRKSPVVQGNAVTLDWTAVLNAYLPSWRSGPISYLSIDIDESTLGALTALLDAGARFRIITSEHDAYRHGDWLRDPIRERLLREDYYLVASNVCSSDGHPYEDWWCSDDLSDAAMPFRSEGLKWADVLAKGGLL
jgi:hypothetical protein